MKQLVYAKSKITESVEYSMPHYFEKAEILTGIDDKLADGTLEVSPSNRSIKKSITKTVDISEENIVDRASSNKSFYITFFSKPNVDAELDISNYYYKPINYLEYPDIRKRFGLYPTLVKMDENYELLSQLRIFTETLLYSLNYSNDKSRKFNEFFYRLQQFDYGYILDTMKEILEDLNDQRGVNRLIDMESAFNLTKLLTKNPLRRLKLEDIQGDLTSLNKLVHSTYSLKGEKTSSKLGKDLIQKLESSIVLQESLKEMGTNEGEMMNEFEHIEHEDGSFDLRWKRR